MSRQRGFTLIAVPSHPKAGSRGFFVNETGVIRFTTVGFPGVDDPPIGG